MIAAADPFAPILCWHSAGYQADPDPAPLYARQWADLLAQCRTALQRRRASYPAMIERGTIAADLAAQDIAAWEALVAEWLWVISGTGQPPAPHTLPDRRAAIALARLRVAQEIRRGNARHDILRQSHLIAALEWHLAQETAWGEPRVYTAARFNHAHRAEIALRWCGQCERWNFTPGTEACIAPDCGLSREKAA